MLKVVFLALVFCLTVAAAPVQFSYAETGANPPAITEAEVKAFWNQGAALVKARRVNELMAMFAPDATIEITADGQTQSFRREDYRQYVEQSFQMVKDYSYSSTINSVSLNGHKATVLATTKETMDLGEYGTFSGTTREVNQIEKRNGKLYVVHLKATVNVAR